MTGANCKLLKIRWRQIFHACREFNIIIWHRLSDASTTAEIIELQSYAVIFQFIVAVCCFRWQLHFVHEKFNELNELYKSALPEEQKLLPWDLRVATVKQVVVVLILIASG